MIEQERKFIVRGLQKEDYDDIEVSIITQGYLYSSESPIPTSMRVRKTETLEGEIPSVVCTITGKVKKDSDSSWELEIEIPEDEADRLLSLCESSIHKIRTNLIHNGVVWSIDEFDPSLGIESLAEVEFNKTLMTDLYGIDIPSWAVKEVTGDPKYLNCNLAKGKRYEC